jgi:Predicted membrane protein
MNMRQKLLAIWNFLTKDIWSLRLSDFSPRKAMQLRALRILLISIKGVYQDKIQLRAAALTLYTIMSIVPMLAMGFGIAKGFNYDVYLKTQAISYFDEKIQMAKDNNDEDGSEDENIDSYTMYKQVSEQLINFADALLAKTKGGLVAVIGLVLLFYTVMKMFGNIESSFNDIWQVKRPRIFIRKFTDYFSMMLISPLLLFSAIFGIVTLKSLKVHSLLSPVLFISIKILPIILIIALFTLIFIIMPNTKVKFSAGLVGGILAGIVFYVTQQVYFIFQIGVSSNNAIYGGFAAVPLFIILLQVSWLIVLFGAKVAYAAQNYEMHEFEEETVHMSDYSRRILALLVTHRIIQNFKEGQKPLSIMELQKELHIPIRMLKAIIQDLVKCRIISEVLTDNPKVTAFQPAQYIDRFTVKFVIEELDKLGETYLKNKHSETTQKLVKIHNNFFETIQAHPDNVMIKDI